mmetsp:Transcript_36820/g.113622  ORF Transcript_36820/g.113622 Transcript_36820/m.113622 type:complete len:585 (-) Transcript_36820:53-1807(-)|eukprot:CAMPEP_0174864458 /NCGR_PEP_ID=MMETSP1114-20130205/58479_1 /TAXON_ID=312471 /ORGANISM="Neobodo designis, Strain CCAP 1951/1" /LENGTH=584 /DNA_ID=CAMNT_0016099563 /DNA_START=492 /DNA_END=2246 /DNA_ORIENTATION=+
MSELYDFPPQTEGGCNDAPSMAAAQAEGHRADVLLSDFVVPHDLDLSHCAIPTDADGFLKMMCSILTSSGFDVDFTDVVAKGSWAELQALDFDRLTTMANSYIHQDFATNVELWPTNTVARYVFGVAVVCAWRLRQPQAALTSQTKLDSNFRLAHELLSVSALSHAQALCLTWYTHGKITCDSAQGRRSFAMFLVMNECLSMRKAMEDPTMRLFLPVVRLLQSACTRLRDAWHSCVASGAVRNQPGQLYRGIVWPARGPPTMKQYDKRSWTAFSSLSSERSIAESMYDDAPPEAKRILYIVQTTGDTTAAPIWPLSVHRGENEWLAPLGTVYVVTSKREATDGTAVTVNMRFLHDGAGDAMNVANEFSGGQSGNPEQNRDGNCPDAGDATSGTQSFWSRIVAGVCGFARDVVSKGQDILNSLFGNNPQAESPTQRFHGSADPGGESADTSWYSCVRTCLSTWLSQLRQGKVIVIVATTRVVVFAIAGCLCALAFISVAAVVADRTRPLRSRIWGTLKGFMSNVVSKGQTLWNKYTAASSPKGAADGDTSSQAEAHAQRFHDSTDLDSLVENQRSSFNALDTVNL